MPVLDHRRTPGDERPCGLLPLPVEGGLVHPRVADRLGVGLGDQERSLLGAVHPVGVGEQRPHARGGPELGVLAGAGQGEGLLHPVVGVAGGDVEGASHLLLVEGGPVIGDAGGDELVLAGVLAHHLGLPADEVRGQLRLEAPPGERVLRLHIRVRPPQVRPVAQPVRPVGEAPFAVEVFDGAVLATQMVDELLEHLVVREDLVAGLVVDLVPDHRGMVRIAGDDLPDHPLGVE